MTTRYFIYKGSVEKDALDRWENEGGRLRQDRDYMPANNTIVRASEQTPRRARVSQS